MRRVGERLRNASNSRAAHDAQPPAVERNASDDAIVTTVYGAGVGGKSVVGTCDGVNHPTGDGTGVGAGAGTGVGAGVGADDGAGVGANDCANVALGGGESARCGQQTYLRSCGWVRWELAGAEREHFFVGKGRRARAVA